MNCETQDETLATRPEVSGRRLSRSVRRVQGRDRRRRNTEPRYILPSAKRVADQRSDEDTPSNEDCLSLHRAQSSQLSTREAEQMTYYIARFYHFTHQMCAWTELLELPRRSAIPPITRAGKRSARGMTNWANFYLPHLATGANDDPLSLAMVVLTAYKMRAREIALAFYSKVLGLLRRFIRTRNLASTSNQEFLRAWATTLLLAEYEAQQGNQRVRARHIDGATTMCLLAERRPVQKNASRASSTSDQSADSEAGSDGTFSKPDSGMTSQLSAHLQLLTQRYRHSSTICLPIETEWPTNYSAASQRSVMSNLLVKSAECFAYCMQIVELYFNELNKHSTMSKEELMELEQAFEPQVLHAKAQLRAYDTMLQQVRDKADVQESCSVPGTPFSPIIKFGNPHMIQAHLVPHVLRLLLSPFIPQARDCALRYIAGVYAGLESSPEYHIDAAYPDVYIFAFWKAGAERDYFANHISRRRPEFGSLIYRIWKIIDATEARLGGALSSTDIIRLTLREYKMAQLNASFTSQSRYFQIEGLMARSWSVAIGSDPSTNFVTGPHTQKYRARINRLRQSFHNLDGSEQNPQDAVFAFRESGPLRDQEVEYDTTVQMC